MAKVSVDWMAGKRRSIRALDPLDPLDPLDGGSVSDGDLSGKISRIIIMAGHSGGNLERFVDVMCGYMTIEVDISHLSNLAWLILAAEA